MVCVITSAEEFVQLRTSRNPDEYHRAAHEEASVETWLDVIERFPDMRSWVAHNKTVPLEPARIGESVVPSLGPGDEFDGEDEGDR